MTAKKEIVDIIKRISGQYPPYVIFSDWVEMMALSIQNTCDLAKGAVWEKREQQFNDIRKKYTDAEFTLFAKMLMLLCDAFEDGFGDILGEIYMESDSGNKYTGQFFTPFNVSKMCADCMIPKDYDGSHKLTLNEPSVGGGGMIIATAAILHERGINYQLCMDVVGQDLDWKAVYMSYVQFSLLGISAEVVQGSTLTEPYCGKGYPPERVFRTPKKMGVLV